MRRGLPSRLVGFEGNPNSYPFSGFLREASLTTEQVEIKAFHETSLTQIEEKVKALKSFSMKSDSGEMGRSVYDLLAKGEPIPEWTDKNYKKILKSMIDITQSDPVNPHRWHQDSIMAIPEYRDEILSILKNELPNNTDDQKVNTANIYIGMYKSDRVGNTYRSSLGLSSVVVRRLVQVYISAVIREMSVPI